MGVREQMVKPATVTASNFAFPPPWSPTVKQFQICEASVDGLINDHLESEIALGSRTERSLLCVEKLLIPYQKI